MSHNPPNAGRASTSATGGNDKWMNYCIYKIPRNTKAQNPDAYSPQSASIGPYHKGEPHLQAMEEHKARALDRFLRRRANLNLPYCCQVLKSSDEEFMSSYHSLGEGWKEDKHSTEFLMLMIKDGIFLYEFMRGYPDGVGWEDYDNQDPVFSVRALPNNPNINIVLDIQMLENQLPITVLERLIAIDKGDLTKEYHEEVNKLVFKFLSAELPGNMSQPLGLHVLDISRKVITRKFEQIADHDPPYNTNISVKPAVNLHDAGVKFGKSGGVSFDNAKLTIPLLTFDSTTEPRFLNAIAFECLHPATNHEVCSYIAFLQGLIASRKDVKFLQSKDLIQSKIGDEQAVYGLMKTISKNVFFDRSSDLCEVRDRLNKYYTNNMKNCKRRRREWARTLRLGYLKNPCTIIALVGATSILIFSGLQTVYTMLGYYQGN